MFFGSLRRLQLATVIVNALNVQPDLSPVIMSATDDVLLLSNLFFVQTVYA